VFALFKKKTEAPVGVAAEPKRSFAEKLKDKRFRMGSFATVLTALFIVAVIIVNVIATYLVDNYPLDIDLTSNKIFQLSDTTKDFLEELDKDVKIYICATEEEFHNDSTSYGQYLNQAATVIDNYAKLSDKIDVEYVDLTRNPTFTARYPSLTISSGNVLVESVYGVKQINISDLFEIDYSYIYYGYDPRITSSVAEQTMTSAIMNVTSDEKSVITVLTGHGETDISAFTALLESNNYEIRTKNIRSEEIDEDTEVLIIAAPTTDYTDEEVKKVEMFLDNEGNYGRHLVYFASTEQPAELPYLKAYLKEVGIDIGSGTVYETNPAKRASSNNYLITIPSYSGELFTGDFASKRTPFVMPYAVPMNLAFESQGFYEAEEFLSYGDTARIYPADAAEDYTADPDTDEAGPFAAGIVSSKFRYAEGNIPVYSRVVAVASVDVIGSTAISATSYVNSEYMVDLFGTLVGRDTSVKISSKTLDNAALTINAAQSWTIIVGFALIPIAVIVAGIVVWIRRRNK